MQHHFSIPCPDMSKRSLASAIKSKPGQSLSKQGLVMDDPKSLRNNPSGLHFSFLATVKQNSYLSLSPGLWFRCSFSIGSECPKDRVTYADASQGSIGNTWQGSFGIVGMLLSWVNHVRHLLAKSISVVFGVVPHLHDCKVVIGAVSGDNGQCRAACERILLSLKVLRTRTKLASKRTEKATYKNKTKR